MKPFSGRVKDAVCPSCQNALNGATVIDDSSGAPPTGGDVTVCTYCTAFLEYRPDMSLALLTAEQLADLPADVRSLLVRSRAVIKALKRSQGYAK